LAKRAFVYGLEWIASRGSDAELVQNIEDMDVLRRLRVPERRLHLLGNGIDLTRFDPDRVDRSRRKELRREWGIPDDAIVCGVVGRLVWEKGYREVFDAARQLRARVPDLHFVVVGPSDDDKADGITEHDLREAARGANLTFLGLRQDVDACYTAFDLFALASHREGFPRAAMEAAALGLPVVATDIRGCRQVVDDGANGVLVPPRDAARLAAAIETVATDGALRRRMGEAGRAKAHRDFDQQRCIDITLGTYADLGIPGRAGVTA